MASLTFCSEEFAGNVEGFTSNDYYPLAIEELFCDSASKATKQVALAVNDNLEDIMLASVRSIARQLWVHTTGSKVDILSAPDWSWIDPRSCGMEVDVGVKDTNLL